MAAKDLTINGVTCSRCPSYSRGLQRCTRGKVLPVNIKKAVEIVELMGSDYLCPHLNAASLEKILDSLNKKHAAKRSILLAICA
jgi:hypothetical protein